MRKITTIFGFLFLFSSLIVAQGEIDALRFSREDLYGTARAMSMGGAFGALGGDMTGVTINPAGIAVYRSSEVVGTLNISNERSSVGSNNANRTRFDMDHLGFVGYFPLRNSVVPLINFGFSYNQTKSFDKEVLALGNTNSSLMSFIANRSHGIDPQNLMRGDNLPDPFLTEAWLPILGFNSGLIYPENGTGPAYLPLNIGSENIQDEIFTRELGYINNYDFTVGTTLNGVLNLGLSLSIKDVSYSLTSEYLEDFADGGYTLFNWLTTSGAGVSAKFGAIYRPINELRIGLSYHTPTWYALTMTYDAEMVHDLEAYAGDGYEPGGIYSERFINHYDLKSPGKLVASAAGVLGSRFIVSMDYEMVNYSNMRLGVPSNSADSQNWFDIDNEYIEQDFKPTSTVKLGMEYRFTPQMYGRLGYAWMQNPYEADAVELAEAGVAGSNTIFRMEGDTNYFTGGLGYRFNRNFYLDAAIVYKTQNDDLYAFPRVYSAGSGDLLVDSAPYSLKNNSIRGLITLGYRF